MADDLTPAQQAALDARKGKNSGSSPTFYHLYHCVNEDCHKKANPIPNSTHQRGVHVKTQSPVKVKCPGCGNAMQLASYPHTEASIVREAETGKALMRDGKPLFAVIHYGKEYRVVEGDPLVYQAVGHESVDQTADLEKEWAA